MQANFTNKYIQINFKEKVSQDLIYKGRIPATE